MREDIKSLLRKIAQTKYGLENAPDFSVDIPENPRHGDYAANVALILSGILKKNPLEIADEIAGIVNALPAADSLKKNIARAEAAPPGFINFFVSPEFIAKNLGEIIKKKEKFGQGAKKKQTIVIEYSSPNIAKPMGIHHLRTTIIGQALANIYDFSGYKVKAMSFPGDWGTQFGSLIAAYKKWGNEKKMAEDPIKEMLALYVRFSREAKENESLREEAKMEFKKLEDGDKENRRLWKRFRDESFRDFNRVYKMLGVKIPLIFSESYFEPMLKEILRDAKTKGVSQEGEDGSVIIPLRNEKTPLLLRKSDGATLYATRDLAQMKYRMRRWKPEKILMVVADQQAFYFRQLFEASELLGYAKRGQTEHVKFGMVFAPGGGKFATREGKLIPMEDVLKEAIERAGVVVEKLNPDFSAKEKKRIAQNVGIGAVKFFDLSQNRLSDIVFEWDRILNLKGVSAPYVQYTYARMKSILRKAGKINFRKISPNVFKEEKELIVLRHLLHFREAVEDAAQKYEPNRLAEYLLKLAEKVNSFYESVPILQAEETLRKSRLCLATSAAIILKSGMRLLGIDMPERM